MEYTLIEASRRSIALRVDEDGKVIVRAPYRCSKKLIETFISQKKEWILEQMAKSADVRLLSRTVIEDGERVMLLGLPYAVIYADGNVRSRIEEGRIVLPREWYPRSADAVTRMLTGYARKYFDARLHAWAQLMGVTVPKLRISSAGSRWGSCAAHGSIMLVWRLVMAPRDVIDYVIVHELAHRLHLDHSPSFWAAVEKVIPDYRRCKHWLDEHGHTLVV